ncbi:Immunoglobulin lambda variable 10-54 [Plecturocebus cupreus]
MANLANTNTVPKSYRSVIEDVIDDVRDIFLDDGLDDQVLMELKTLWENRRMQSRAVDGVHSEEQQLLLQVQQHHHHHHQVSVAQAGLAQPSSVSKGLRQTATLTCPGNSSNVGSQGAAWRQQRQGHAPKLLSHRGNHRPSAISERFSACRSGITASLTVTGLQPEGEAVYYCSAWDSSLSAHTGPQISGETRQKLKSSPGLTEHMGTSRSY